MYKRCGGDVLGVRPNTSGEEVLVRLGWLNLDYKVVLHGIKWYLKFRFGLCGTQLKSRTEFVDTNSGSLLFRRVYEFLVYLGSVVGRGPLCRDILRDDIPLRDIMYTDLRTVYESSIFDTGTTVSDRDYFSHVLGNLTTSTWQFHNQPGCQAVQ